MLDRLIAFLRASLAGSRAGAQTLAVELDRLRDYLALMEVRMGPRLATRFALAGDAAAAQVPPLLLQPIVENAVKHGIAPLRAGGAVTVVARLDTSDGAVAMLSMVVHDSGAGASENALRFGREAGVGLKNVERRLACQYGPSATVSIQSVPGVGTTVEIRMPAEYRTIELAPSRSAS
jgi:LytS/YehU family sensor histidine kinase